MAYNVTSSSSAVAPRSANLITELNDDDVLLGRGSGPNQFIGNQRFRGLVEVRREDYNWAHKNKEKNKIAMELVDQIQSLGGRFLKLVESETSADDAAEEEVWYEVEESVALEKCKQSLREHREKRSSDGTNQRLNLGIAEDVPRERNIVSSSDVGFGIAVNPASFGGFVHGHPPSLPPHLTPLLPSILAGSVGPCVGDVYHLLFQATLFALQQQAMAAQPVATNTVNPYNFNRNVQTQNDMNVFPDVHAPAAGSMSQGQLQDQYSSVNSDVMPAYRRSSANSHLSSRLLDLMPRRTDFFATAPTPATSTETGDDQSPGAMVVSHCKDSSCTVASSNPSTSENGASAAVSEDEASDFLLFCVQASGRPRFTEEQEKIEQATMTDEEKAAALSDLFGRSCSVSTHKNKRAKLDLDRNSIAFLVQQMRLELERIPVDRKRALVEAQMKCLAEEFSDARLERFLRCEGMNAKLGAQRFVNYWESRQELFGPEKFALRMTLNEALSEDLAAVEACFVRPLPRLDTSGRQLLLIEPCRHTREGYTAESMLRAIWYVIEVLAQENTDIRSGVVAIVWDKDFTIWDYDDRLNERMAYFDMKCWPVKLIATHICCPPWFMVKIVKPILYALIDKHARSRILFHDIPESQVLGVLSEYGILKGMLPTEMGGTALLDQAEWIASRRAAELGEI